MAEDEAALALAFAKAVARPGGAALLIDTENRGNGWVAIDEAVDLGGAFSVEPCEQVVAIDVDTEEDRHWAETVRKGLADIGCRFVLVESGRSGHQHLWVLQPPGWTYEYVKGYMEAAAGPPPNGWGQVRRNAVRPPCSPHRLGGRSEIVDPGVAIALKWFREHRPGPIPALARAILTESHPEAVVSKRGVVDRGRSIHRAAVSMVNARCTFEMFESLLLESDNAVTSKYWEMATERRRAFAERAWDAAAKYVREHPVQEPTRDQVRALRDAVPSVQWSARTGANDRCVYRALLDLGEAAATLVVNASIRQLSEATGLSTGTVRAAIRRLTAGGLLATGNVERSPGEAFSYRLRTDLPAKSVVVEHTSSFLRGPKARCVEQGRFLEDIFSGPPGLGTAGREVWDALDATPRKAQEVCERLPGSPARRTVLRHLGRLSRHGFATKTGHRWTRREPDPDELKTLAQMMGVQGRTDRRRRRYEGERQLFWEVFGPEAAPG